MAVTQDKKVFDEGRFTIYKAKKSGDGAASTWKLSRRDNEVFLFVELAHQTGELDANGNSTFDWRRGSKDGNSQPSSSVQVKLGLVDIGEMLLVLNGVNKKTGKDGKGLYHKNQKGATTINFDVWEKDGTLLGYSIRLAAKIDGQTEVNSVSHAISLSEAEVLRVLLQNAVLQMTNWVK